MRKRSGMVCAILAAALVVVSTPGDVWATTDTDIILEEDSASDQNDVSDVDDADDADADAVLIDDSDQSEKDDSSDMKDGSSQEGDILTAGDKVSDEPVLADSGESENTEKVKETSAADNSKNAENAIDNEEEMEVQYRLRNEPLYNSGPLEDASKYAKDMCIEYSADKKELLAKCTVLDKSKEYRALVVWRRNKNSAWILMDGGSPGTVDSSGVCTANIGWLMRYTGEYYAYLQVYNPENHSKIAKGLESEVFAYDVNTSIIGSQIYDVRWDYDSQRMYWRYRESYNAASPIGEIITAVWMKDSGQAHSYYMWINYMEGYAEFYGDKPDRKIGLNDAFFIVTVESKDVSKYHTGRQIMGKTEPVEIGIERQSSKAILTGDEESLVVYETPFGLVSPVYFESSNPSVASVDQAGVVTGKGPGKATITAWVEKANTGERGVSCTCTVTVEKLDCQWSVVGSKSYWYEDGKKQGAPGDKKNIWDEIYHLERGREIYDPASNAWYWLDSVYDGAKAVGKEVWMPYIYQNEKDWKDNATELSNNAGASDEGMRDQVSKAIKEGTGKWVRYDGSGRMMKGWVTIEGDLATIYPKQKGNKYYYDHKTGLMAKGRTVIDGREYYFDEVTGVLKQ